MINSTLLAQLRALIARATIADIPSGIVLWWPGVKLPSGKKFGKPKSQTDWSACYSILVQCELQAGWLRTVSTVNASLRQVAQDGPIPLSLAAFQYAQPRKALRRRIRKAIKSNKPLESVPTDLDNALKNRFTFFASCLLPEQWDQSPPQVRARIFQLEISRALYLANPGCAVPEEIRVDVGNGEQRVRFGDRVTCVAGGKDEVIVKIRARWNKKWLHAACRVPVSPRPAARKPDETWPLSVPGGASGHASVYRGARQSANRRYFIMCEGFPGGYAADYLADLLNQHGMFNAILAMGIDVVTIGLNNGLAAIEDNADVVIAGIDKASETGRHHVVGGISMGGMIARYALLAMQERGLAHHTAAYLSIDTPHQGSRTSVAVQWFAHYFRDVVPRMRDMCTLLNSPANQQFLPQWLDNGTVRQSPLRTRLYDAFQRMGDYPANMKLFAIASGRGDGRAAFGPGQRMVTWSGSRLASCEINAIGPPGDQSPVASGEWVLSRQPGNESLQLRDSTCWEAVAGSTNYYNVEVYLTASSIGQGRVNLEQVTACTVPTVSALDIRNSAPEAPVPKPSPEVSPFDDYVHADKNLSHTMLSADMCDWVLKKLGALKAD